MKKPFLTKLNIVIIVILLLVGVISLFTHIIVTKDSLRTSTGTNLCYVIYNNKELNELLDSKKIPKEILDNLSESECNNVTTKMFDKLYDGEEKILDEIDIRSIIKESIIVYEEKSGMDIYSNIEEDLLEVSRKIVENFNDKSLYSEINTISTVSSYYIIPLVIVVILLLAIIVNEKENSPLIVGLLLISISFVSYYFLLEVPRMLYKHISIIKLLNIDLSIKTEEIATSICCVILFIGLFALAIYVVKKVRKIYRRSRVAYLDRYY